MRCRSITEDEIDATAPRVGGAAKQRKPMSDYGQYIPSEGRPEDKSPYEDSKPPKGSLEEVVDKLAEQVVQVEEMVSIIADALMEIKERLFKQREGSPEISDWKEPGGTKPKSPGAEAFEGERQVEITWDDENSALVVINTNLKIQLSKVLANLLDVLCDDGDYSPDQKVAWKPTSYLLKRLAPPDIEQITKHSLTTNVHRLRDILEEAAGHRLHIESSRLGYRFAKLKSPPESGEII